MAERKRTKAEERAYSELHDLLYELEKVRYDMTIDFERLKLIHVPWDWAQVEQVPVRKRKIRIHAAFDEDVVKFYRLMGHGYQARMNKVLRVYMLGILSRQISSKKNEDWMGNEI